MNKYEMLYVLDKDLADDAKDAIVKKMEDLVVANGGAVEKTDHLGMKKLQYPINYKSEGYYVLMAFSANGAFIAELERVVGITDGIIRRIVTKR